MNIHDLHQRALEAARKLFRAEAELLDLIQKIDSCKGFRELGHTSLFSYVVSELKLSESTALNLINVARKAGAVPALKSEIGAGTLSVCKARKIVPVLSTQNQSEWIEKAKALPTRLLEKEVARVAPRKAFRERVRYATASRINFSLSLEEKTFEAIRRVQDLESQRTGRAASLEETLAAMSALYLERNDPLRKAKRATKKMKQDASETLAATGGIGHHGSDVTRHIYTRQLGEKARIESNSGDANVLSKARRPIASSVLHEIVLRDGARCAATTPNGTRCDQRRWLHIHHVKPVSQGGTSALGNLTTLCSAHHRFVHEREAHDARMARLPP